MTLLRRVLVSVLIVSIGLPVHAGMLPTHSALSAGGRERLASLLERRDVRSQLEAYGVNPADISARVAALTDDEAAQLASRIEALTAARRCSPRCSSSSSSCSSPTFLATPTSFRSPRLCARESVPDTDFRSVSRGAMARCRCPRSPAATSGARYRRAAAPPRGSARR